MIRRSPKSVDEMDCIPTDGTAYIGKANTTESGFSCENWSLNATYNISLSDVWEHNYCRSPDGDDVWCYTTDPGKLWEYCDVPVCVSLIKSTYKIPNGKQSWQIQRAV